MEGPSTGAVLDLEQKAATIADPSIDMRTRCVTAGELREAVDSVRDADAARVFPSLVPTLLELMRTTEVALHKGGAPDNSAEYTFRRILMETLHRICLHNWNASASVESSRNLLPLLLNGMFDVLRRDNEENGVTACRAIQDVVRTYRIFTDEIVREFLDIFGQQLACLPHMVTDTLMSPPDLRALPPAMRSFRVLSEMGIVIVTFAQSIGQMQSTPRYAGLMPLLQGVVPRMFEATCLEAPSQRAARTEFEAMGGFWSGMAPEIRNPAAYTDYITAQIKMVSYLAYIMRTHSEYADKYMEGLELAALRILQDIPATALSPRRDHMVVLRHLLTLPQRKAILPHIDKLLDENVLLGRNASTRETLRATAYAAIADLVHHVRHELTMAQLAHGIHVFSRLFHNPALSNGVHTLAGKMLFGLVDTIVSKESRDEAVRIVTLLLEVSVDRLEAAVAILPEVNERIELGKKGEEDNTLVHVVEAARPIAPAVYATERPEEVLGDIRLLIRTLVHGFRVCFSALKKVENTVVDGTLVSRLFDGFITALTYYEPETRESQELMEWLAQAFYDMDAHVVQQVWTRRMDFFFQCARKRPGLVHLPQLLYGKEHISPTLVAVVLEYLVTHLPQLGEYEDTTAVMTIKLFKLTFSSMIALPAINEPVLAHFLPRLIMDSFSCAARSNKAVNYYHLLRALFRAVGGGQGRFELLYARIHPLLPEILENLNAQLMVSDGFARDLVVELCLTVPLRLTHLVPQLQYLMKPLALSLKGPTDLVNQGLRTLELFIDNLTPGCLDPTLNTVLRELTDALHGLLRPLPANHQHSHTALRILGKLGGRNRRLLDLEPEMDFRHYAAPAAVLVSMGRDLEAIDLAQPSILAARSLRKGGTGPHIPHAYAFLENCAALLVADGARGRNREDVLERSLEGIFDALRIESLKEQAGAFIKQASASLLALELRRLGAQTADPRSSPHASPVFTCLTNAIGYGLALDRGSEANESATLIADITADFVAVARAAGADTAATFRLLARRLCALAVEDGWARKRACVVGIQILLDAPNADVRWLDEREAEIARTLFHILKDMTGESEANIELVTGLLQRVVRLAVRPIPAGEAIPERSKPAQVVGILIAELSAGSSVVRKTAEEAVDLVGKLVGRKVSELLRPMRERMLASVYTKPLRALPFNMQIGMIDAMRYVVGLDPPLPELNDELLRLLHEVLALADAEDQTLIGRGNNARQSTREIMRLRIACIRLLSASLPLTDYFSKQPSTRQKLTAVYFKSLYSPSPEVKEAAHDGLKVLLAHQSRLPKELLQTGLRPILMNLADPKRLSVAGLEGLARLLELLTNYFKVEIGHKLLDHYRVVADPQLLSTAAMTPVRAMEPIDKLVSLTNIFHLLPATANMFLEPLTNAIVQTEAQMHYSAESPFSKPLAKFLERYPIDAADFLMRNLHLPRHVRTYRSILQAHLAPALAREIATRTPYLVDYCLRSGNAALLTPALQIFDDLSDFDINWLLDYPLVVDALLDVWRQVLPPFGQSSSAGTISTAVLNHKLILALFAKVMHLRPRVDLPFEMITVFTRNYPMDLIRPTRLLYELVAFSDDVAYQRSVFYRFLAGLEQEIWGIEHKTAILRLIITPMIVYRARSVSRDALLDSGIVKLIHKLILMPMMQENLMDGDYLLHIELLHFTTVLVQNYGPALEEARRDIIKCTWNFITSEDAMVRQVAYLLAANFFAAYDTPEKFILRAWTGLLKPPHYESRTLVRRALNILTPSLLRCKSAEDGFPVWAKTTRRLLAEESHGQSQLIIVYQVVVQQADLFYPVRALFIPHMVNSLHKLGMHGSASTETRHLSIDLMQTIFDWEQKATEQKPELEKRLVELKAEEQKANDKDKKAKTDERVATEHELVNLWRTPLPYRENVVSYLVRLTTAQHDTASRNAIIARALALLRQIVGPNGWKDVTVKLHFFGRMLEQADLATLSPDNLAAALLFAKVLQVVTADKPDSWYLDSDNAVVLSRLVRKGLLTDDIAFHDALHPIFDRVVHLFPLPKEDEEQHPLLADFHRWVYTSLSDGLQNATTVRSVLLMLQSVVTVTPERIEAFGSSLLKLLGKLSKEHCSVQTQPQANFEATVKLLISTLDICLAGAIHLPPESRRFLTSALTMLVEKSKSPTMCRYLLGIGKTWAFQKNEPYPPTKEKATFLQRMATLESRGEAHFNSYLELVYDIYTDPSLRRSDLTVKLEQSFLLGCRARDVALRERFVDLLDASVPRTLASRLVYIVGVQSWEPLADHYWIPIALHLLLGAVDVDAVQLASRKPPSAMPAGAVLPARRVSEIIQPLKRMLIVDPNVAHDVWMSAFPAAWKSLSRRDQVDVTHHLISLLSREYHSRQAEKRPNVIQTLLTSINLCTPAIVLPPHLIKFLAKTFGAWHAGMEILQTMNLVLEEDPSIRDTIPDSLAELYAELAEEDLFYGLWRRRSLHNDTNIAVAFEQNGMWTQASATYEAAQSKTRSGTLPYAESEYIFWEDHWILAAEKLQHWDVLYDYARNDHNPELLLESAWRTKNWSQDWETIQDQVDTLPMHGTLRRRVFESFLALVKPTTLQEKNAEFMRVLEDGMQLALRKWVSLPSYMSSAHIPILHHFQQFVELQEAVQIFGSLAVTNESNLEKKSSELKLVLQAWRERLPNMHDDIDIWSDLVAWRQNVFQAINKAYMPFVDPSNTGGHGTNSGNNSGYRGYHETAWIINRFAHVTRKHQLYDVCQSLLGKIYQLPNIEISEAFLKLREQARCHLRSSSDLQAGLDVINSTNLMYFSVAQKAEFSTLKGIFNAALGHPQEANDNFSAALSLESNLPKTWQEWAKFNDNMFSETNDVQYAAQAVSCYLQAAGMFKSGKTRMLLSRVLWLLGVEDPSLVVLKAFDTYKGEAAYWYWISLIPQLCTSISNRESRQARFILLNIAKLYPQALFFHLRTTRDEMAHARRNVILTEQRLRTAIEQQQQRNGGDVVMQDAATNGNVPDQSPQRVPNVDPQLQREAQTAKNMQRPGSEYIDEVVQILKTAFPLLILSMESMVEQLNSRFKASQDENTYRFISMLLQEALQTYAIKVNQTPDEPGMRPETMLTMQRVLHDIPVVYRADFESDFLDKKKPPTLNEYIRRLQSWRDRYEKVLDARPRVQSLEMLSHYLTEFQYSKFDDIEIPGQYTEDKDGNQNFVRIARFGHQFENCRVQGQSWKRFTMIGQDNSVVSWVVQLPAHRYSRREERLMQTLRMFNQLLRIKKECRKRNLHFHIPAAVSCSPSLRLYQQDSSYVSLGEICDQFCEESGVAREDPILIPGEKVKTILKEFTEEHKRMPDKLEYFNLKKDLLEEVMNYMIPDNVLSKYMARTMTNPADLWLMRKQFAKHLAGTMFTTYLFCLTNRLPFRFLISRRTGQVCMSEMLPGYSSHAPVFQSNDIVPFRYTPNMQQFAGDIHQEGTIPTILYQLGRCLSLPEFDLEKQLTLYGRDEVAAWFMSRGVTWNVDMGFRQHVSTMVEGVVKRANTMGCKLERDQATENPQSPSPANVTLVHTVTKLISAATDPMNLMKMTEIYHPWF